MVPEPLRVREGGVEPPRPLGHTDLNRARLPIPPLAREACKGYPSAAGDPKLGDPVTIVGARRVPPGFGGADRRGQGADRGSALACGTPCETLWEGGAMGGLQNFENKLEQLISGVFARAFRSAVQPVEISAALQREVDNNAQILSRDRRLVPNDFHVELSPTDLDRLAPYDTAMAQELVSQLEQHAD